MPVLSRRVASGLGAAAAFRAVSAALPDGVALLMNPAWFSVAAVQGDELLDADGAAIDLERVFELRAFGARGELRWLASSGGRAAWIGDPGTASDWEVADLEYAVRRPLRYLLWGQATSDGSVTTLREARVSEIRLPVNVRGDRAWLHAEEYWGVVDGHGNVRVVEERFKGIGNWEDEGGRS